jgi:hypothetical protein
MILSESKLAKMLLRMPTYKSFRNSQAPAKEPRRWNLLEPFRFSPVLPTGQFVPCLEVLIDQNADRVFRTILSISGMVEPTTTVSKYRESFLQTGMLDFPNIFQWFFNHWSKGPSIAEMGLTKVEIMFHHIKSAVREQV